MRTRWTLIGLLVVVVLGALWLRGKPESEQATPTLDPEAGSSEKMPGLQTGVRAEPIAVPEPALRPAGGASIRGTVLRDGEPAQAHIEVREAGDMLSTMRSLLGPIYRSGPAIAAVATGKEGDFHIKGLTLGTYEVRAKGADGAVAWQRTFCRPGAPHAVARLSLWGGEGTLEARARYVDGRPFRGLVSPSTQVGFRSLWLPEVETDAQGRFQLEGLRSGPLSLSFVLPGVFRSGFLNVRRPLPVDRVFVVDEGLSAYSGRVIADDTEQPIPSAQIAYASTDKPGGRSYTGTTETDAAGTFEIMLPTTESRLWIDKDGFERLQAHTKKDQPILFRLKRRGRVTGRVVNAQDGSPVAGVAVHGSNWYTFGLKSPLDVSAEDGAFDAIIGPGKGMLYALGNGWLSPGLSRMKDRSVIATLLEVGQGASVAHDLPVVRTATIVGTVRDASGVPVAGAPISAELPARWRGFRRLSMSGENGSAVSDTEGAFRLENLVPGFPYQVVARPHVGLPARSDTFELGVGETRTVEVRVPDPRWLPVCVVETESGAPIQGALVWASQVGRYSVNGETDADGRLRLGPLLPAEFTVTARHANYMLERGGAPFGGRAKKRPDPGSSPDVVVLPLQRGGFVAGVVQGTDGAPFKEGQIGLFPVGQKVGKRFGLAGLATLENEGRFRLGPVVPGTYDLVLVEKTTGFNRRQLSRWTVDTGDEDLVLRVDPSQRESDENVTFIQVNGPAGKPANGHIRVMESDRVVMNTSWLPEGRHELRDIERGMRVWIEIRGPTAADGTPLSGVVHGPVKIEPGTVEIRLRPAPSLTGVVLRPDGTPCRGVVVQQLLVMPPEVAATASTFAAPGVRTDEKGRFQLPGSELPIELLVTVPADLGQPTPFPVGAGQTEIELRLRDSDGIDVTVTTADGAALAGAEVVVSLRMDGVPVKRAGTTNARGLAQLEGLAAGMSYTLEVRPPAARSDLCAERRALWRAASTTVVLPPGRHIHGKASDLAAPASYATVFWMDARGEWRETRTDNKGAFRVTAVAGPVVFVGAPNGSRRRSAGGPEVRIDADATEVTVHLQ